MPPYVHAFLAYLPLLLGGSAGVFFLRAVLVAEANALRSHLLASHGLQLATVEADAIARAVLAAKPASLAAAMTAARDALVPRLRSVAGAAYAAGMAVHGGGWADHL